MNLLRIFSLLSIPLIFLIKIVGADFSTRLVQMRTLDSILNPSKYDKRIRPNAYNESDPIDKPIVISFNVFVRDIQEVNIVSKTVRMQINLRYEWTDARLKYDDINGKIIYLNIGNTSRIWTPDIFFPNELTGTRHSIVTDNSLTRIYPDGRIYHASRFTLTLICANMKLNRYPLDKQVCPLQIAPWAFMKTEVLFQFGVKEPKVGPVVMTKKLYSLPNYQLVGTDTTNCSSSFLQSRYTCIEVLFTFQRSFYQPMTRIFTPTMFLLILSWIPFFLRGSPEEVDSNAPKDPLKVTTPVPVKRPTNSILSFVLSISSLLSLIILTNHISSNGPSIDTTNAGDIWTGVCLTLSFLAFVNVCIIEILQRKNSTLADQSEPSPSTWSRGGSLNRRRSLNHVRFEAKSEIVTVEEGKDEKKEETSAKKDDIAVVKTPVIGSGSKESEGIGIAKIREYIVSNQVRCAVILGQFLHPTVFVLFNIIYWTCLTRGAVVAPSS